MNECKHVASAEQGWAIETMLLINKLTPDIKGKAFDPDWFLLRQRLEEMERRFSDGATRIRCLEADLNAMTDGVGVAALDEVRAYAEELAAPARELLYLYDWRPELAKMEKELKNDGTDPVDKVKEVRRLLREYGERKKAGWVALRAALAKNPNVQDPAGDDGPGKAGGGGQSPATNNEARPSATRSGEAERGGPGAAVKSGDVVTAPVEPPKDSREGNASPPHHFDALTVAHPDGPNPWGLCEGCPPVGYPSNKTRCLECPRRDVHSS